MFADSVIVTVKAGKGGNGLSSFRHEKYISRGGPDGGNGGNGGNVIMIADHNLNTLAKFRNQPLVVALDGEQGGPRRQHGKYGEDVIITVPIGTSIYNGPELLADLTEDNQSAVVARGGRGGFGNAHFKSSVRQAPRIAEIGEPGEEWQLSLELKLIADVGLVGLPNAGKSTFLSVVSNAKPEIADYPFTTLTPNLGVADIDDDSLLIADIPGLIEGASKGKGLGDAFLRHIERTSVLLHLIDGTDVDVAGAWQTITQELSSYQVDLSIKSQVTVLTKIDALTAAQVKTKVKQLQKQTKQPVMAISASAHDGVTELLRKVAKLVKQQRKIEAVDAENTVEEVPTLSLADDPSAWWVEKEKQAYVVKGQKIQGFARRTDTANNDGVARLRDIMHKMGIDRELVRLGAKTGDRINIAGKNFDW